MAVWEVTDGDVVKLVSAIRGRVVRYLRRLGKWVDVGDEDADAADGDADLLLELDAAAVQGRTALGERAGERDVRVGRGSQSEPFVKRPLCADVDGFSLHAAVWVAARDRERLEKLCRYAGATGDRGVAAAAASGWAGGLLAEEALAGRHEPRGAHAAGADGTAVCAGAAAEEAPGDLPRRAGTGGFATAAGGAAGGGR